MKYIVFICAAVCLSMCSTTKPKVQQNLTSIWVVQFVNKANVSDALSQLDLRVQSKAPMPENDALFKIQFTSVDSKTSIRQALLNSEAVITAWTEEEYASINKSAGPAHNTKNIQKQ